MHFLRSPANGSLGLPGVGCVCVWYGSAAPCINCIVLCVLYVIMMCFVLCVLKCTLCTVCTYVILYIVLHCILYVIHNALCVLQVKSTRHPHLYITFDVVLRLALYNLTISSLKLKRLLAMKYLVGGDLITEIQD